MKTELLEEYLVLSKTLNFRAAAESLFITQPTLSKHMMELERELGIKLLERDTKKVSLTQDGCVIAQKAAHLVDMYYDLLSYARRDDENRLCVAAPLRFTSFGKLIARVREAFACGFPRSECWVQDFSLGSLPAEVLSAGCDIVVNVYLQEYETRSVTAVDLCKANLCVWASASGVLADKTAVSVDELGGMVFRPASGREDYPWPKFVSRTLEEKGGYVSVGAPLDDQYQLGPLDFALVFGGEPSASLGSNARQIDLTEAIPVTVAAYYRSGRRVRVLDHFVELLKTEAPLIFSSSGGQQNEC